MISAAVLRFAPRAPAPSAVAPAEGLAGSVLVEDEGALREIVIQYAAAQGPAVEETYTDFLRALDPSTRVIAVVAAAGDAEGRDADALAALLARIDPSGALAARTRVVETEGPITVWSKDRALVLAPPLVQRALAEPALQPPSSARPDALRTQLVVPVRPDPRWRQRFNDWATLAAIAREMPRQYVVTEVPLEYDAGDFAVTGDTMVVDVNLLGKNAKRGLATPRALMELLARTFKKKIVFLGERDGDVPRHHLSMYMTPLGGGVVLVGDPRAGRELVGEGWKPGEESPDTDEPLVADFSEASVARFERAAADLAAAGFRVERVPVVPFDDKTYLTYTNGVYETRGGRKIVYLPQYATDGAPAGDSVRRADAVAAEAYRRLGWDTRPIRVRGAYRFHGTIGCLTNVLRRGDGP